MVLEKDPLKKEEVATPKISVPSLGGLFGKQAGWWTGGLRDNCGDETPSHATTCLPLIKRPLWP